MKMSAPRAIQAVALVLNVERRESVALGRLVARVAARLKVRVFPEQRSARLMGRAGESLARVVARSDGVIVAGGDGTLLATVPEAAARGCPVLGINAGSLGFLTAIPAERAERAVEAFLKGDWCAHERTLLEARVSRGGGAARRAGVALNEAALGRGAGPVLARFSVRVDDELVSDYSADGLIVATPTGSTAYSLSSGGAVLTPDAPVFILTPVCPHTLTNRPVIVSDRSVVRIRPEAGCRMVLTLDGHRCVRVEAGGEVELRLAPERLVLATLRNYNFFKVLRGKLRWSGSYV